MSEVPNPPNQDVPKIRTRERPTAEPRKATRTETDVTKQPIKMVGRPVLGVGTIPNPCSEANEDAELDKIMQAYTNAVTSARNDAGYQCASDPNYRDPGASIAGYVFGTNGHPIGNCVDWQRLTWGALVVTTWSCWTITKIKADKDWSPLLHHFIRISSRGGRVFFLDPWTTGKPDVFEADTFPFGDDNGWDHTAQVSHKAGAKVLDPAS